MYRCILAQNLADSFIRTHIYPMHARALGADWRLLLRGTVRIAFKV